MTKEYTEYTDLRHAVESNASNLVKHHGKYQTHMNLAIRPYLLANPPDFQ